MKKLYKALLTTVATGLFLGVVGCSTTTKNEPAPAAPAPAPAAELEPKPDRY